MKTKILSLATVSVALLGLRAQADDAGYAFLKIAPGARAAAMGAFTAVQGDAQALTYNPAGIAGSKERYAVSASHVELFEDMRLENVVFTHKALGGTMGYSLVYLNEGTMEGRDAQRRPTGDFKSSEYAGQVTYAGQTGMLSYGIGVKGIHSKIENESGTGYAFDGGVGLHAGNFDFAASVLNLGKGPKLISESSSLPTTLNAGVGYQFRMGLLVTGDVRQNVPERRTTFAVGGELPVYGLIYLRGGYIYDKENKKDPDQKVPRGMSAGFGLSIATLRVDYAISSLGELGYTHRFTLGFGF